MVILAEYDQEPRNYEEARTNIDAELWQKAINLEIESIYSNKVWTLIEPLAGVKPIGYTRIYKKKNKVDGKVETYKARLIAKGYTQKEGIDYEKTFSSAAMVKSIRILLSISAILDYKM